MSVIENRRLAQEMLDQLYVDVRFEAWTAKDNAIADIRSNRDSKVNEGRYYMSCQMLKILDMMAGRYQLRIPKPEPNIKLVVDNTK